MLVTKVSILSNIQRTKELDITEKDYQRFLRKEALVQDIFPDLSINDREFLVSGIIEDEWDIHFPEEEEEF